MCFQGVWFMGRSPNGPWEVTGSVPGQIYEIPVSSPSYNVTNVTVVEDNSDAVVFATAAAYTGLMIGWGCAVWGTGYYYPPYVGYGGFYPVLPPVLPHLRLPRLVQPVDRRVQPRRRRRTVRTAAPASARATTRGPAPTRAARRRTVRTARAASPAPTTRAPARPAATRQGSGVYGSWGQTGVQRGDQWATHVARHQQSDRHDDARDAGQRRRRRRHAERRRQGSGGVARTGSGDVYAGRDGNVYRKQDGGGWQQSATAARTAQQRALTASSASANSAESTTRTSSIAIQRPARKARSEPETPAAPRAASGVEQLPSERRRRRVRAGRRRRPAAVVARIRRQVDT